MRRMLIIPLLACVLGFAASREGLADATLSVSFLRFYDLNMNNAFDCGEMFDVRATFEDDAPPQNVGTYHGHLRVPVNPSQFAYYSFQQDAASSALCSILNVTSGNSHFDPYVDVEFSCPIAAPPNNRLALSLIMTGSYLGPTGPIFLEATADVDEVNTGQHLTLETPFYYYSVTGCFSDDLALTKSDGGITSAPGKTVPYTLTATNQGGATALSSVLHETVPTYTSFNATASSPGWTCTPSNQAGSACTLSLGNIVPGGSAARIFAVDIGTNVPTSVTAITNTASVSSSIADSNPSNNTATDTTPITPGVPDLQVTKTTSSTGASPGSSITWTLTVANTGNAGADGVVLNETIPTGTTYAAALSSAGWSCSGSSCTSSLGTIAAGNSISRQFAVQIPSPIPVSLTTVQNTACASTTTPGEPTGNNCGSTSTPVTGSPLLQIHKAVASGTAAPGTSLVWGVTATNTGNRDAGAVTLTETVPAATSFDPAASSAGWACSPSSAAGSTCTLSLSSLAGSGGSATRNFATLIANPLPASVTSIANSACAATPGSADACTTVSVPSDGSPHVSITKRLTSGNGAPGSVLVYTLSAQNTGNQDAANVVLQEAVPDNTTWDSTHSAPDWTCAGSAAESPCSLTLPLLAGGGGSTTRTFAVLVDNPLPAGVTSIQNVACVASGAVGAVGARRKRLPPASKATGDTCDTVIITPMAAPVLEIRKALSSGNPASDQTVVYTLTVSNTGNQNASNVVVTDTIPASTSEVAGGGWICSPTAAPPSTCSLAIGNLTAGASQAYPIAFRIDSSIPTSQTTLVNQACVTDGPRSACASTSDPLAPSGMPSLHLKKSYAGGPLRPGALVAFDLLVSNSGTASANAVRLQETVPAGVTFSAGDSDAAWSCSGVAAGSTCSLVIPTLAAGASKDVAFAVRAPNPLPPGLRQVANSACLLDSTGNAIVCDQTSTPLDVVLTLTLDDSLAVDANHDGYLSAGDTLLYTLVLTNPSTLAAKDISLTTGLDPHLALIVGSVTTNAGSVYSGNHAGDTMPTVVVSSLDPGKSVTVTLEVLPTDLKGLREVASQATVSGSNFENTLSDDPQTPEPHDPTRTPVTGAPVAPIPTLGTLGLAALVLALAAAALLLLRRRPAL